MYAGRLAEVGPAADVLRAAAHPYTAALTGHGCRWPRPAGRPLPTLAGEPPDPRGTPARLPVRATVRAAPRRMRRRTPGAQPGRAGPPIRLHPAAEQVRAIQSADKTAAGAPPTRLPNLPGVPNAVRTRAEPVQADTTDPAARVRDVAKTFRVKAGRRRADLRALRGVDPRAWPRARRSRSSGRAAAGKSTLLRIVAGLEQPTAARSSSATPGARPQMVFQDAGASLTPWLTVGELIGERLRARSARPETEARQDRAKPSPSSACRPRWPSQGGPALRRPAPAGRAGPGDRRAPRGAAVRRADERARRVAGRRPCST